jgi:hypothetical protein
LYLKTYLSYYLKAIYSQIYRNRNVLFTLLKQLDGQIALMPNLPTFGGKFIENGAVSAPIVKAPKYINNYFKKKSKHFFVQF